MLLYSYTVRYDYGFAPNPFDGWCTLATCKSRLRERAAVGDWIVGTGSSSKGLLGKLVFAMRVDERLTFDEYWEDPRFQRRTPQLRGSEKRKYGDNIYHRGPDGAFVQADSRHSMDDGTPHPKWFADDTSCEYVLVSGHFTYWGRQAVEIPGQFRHWGGTIDICVRRHFKYRPFPDDMRAAFVHWVEGLEEGYCGDPADW